MLIVGPNFRVGLRVQDDVVVEASRPIGYMRGWSLERVRALCRRWDWKIELNDAELAQQARAQAQAGGRSSSEASREGDQVAEATPGQSNCCQRSIRR